MCIVREYKFNEAYVNLNYDPNCTFAYQSSESSSWQQLHASSTLANGAVLGPILDNSEVSVLSTKKYLLR